MWIYDFEANLNCKTVDLMVNYDVSSWAVLALKTVPIIQAFLGLILPVPPAGACVCVFAPGSTAFWSAALVNEFADRKQAGERLRAQRQKETFSRSHEVTFTATANMLTAAFSPCTSRSGPVAEVRENKHQERKQRLSEEQKHWVFHRESLFGTGHYPTIKLYQPK